MAKSVIKKATILLHDLDVSGFHNNVDPGVRVEEKECSNYAGDGWREYLAGLLGTEIALEGYLESETIEATQFDLLTPDTYYPFLVSLDRPLAADSIAFFTKVFLTQWQRRAQIGEIYGYSGQAQRGEQAPLVRGRVTDNLTAATSGNGAALDLNEAIAADEKLFVGVWVTGVSDPGDTLDLELESDADTGMATPTSRLVIPQITGTGSYFGTVDGPITDEAWRFVRTITGAVSFVAAIGRVPVN